MDKREKTFVLYDDTYIGNCPGYFIITERDEQIIRFAKIYQSSNNGFPYFNARAFETGSIDQPDQDFREISFVFDKNDDLFEPVLKLASHTLGDPYLSINYHEQGDNNLKSTIENDKAILTFSKDVLNVKNATDFIDINIGDDILCRHYLMLWNFYHELGQQALGKASAKEVQKIKEL